jgi:pimeloyl-ACP methyl ester carboxylesterase
MKSSTVFALSSVSFLAAMALMPGCSDDESSSSSSSSSSGSPGDDAGDGAVAIRDLGAPNIPCQDSADSLYGDPGALPAANGEIIKCHEDPVLSQDGVQAALTAAGYKGRPVTSGARVFRVLFRTERGNTANTPSSSTALVYIPTVPRANDLPIVVGARGSRGQGPECTASKRKPGLGVNVDLDRLVYTIVGHGYPLIVPDLPGYANFGASGNPPSAYNDARDVGKGTLDGSKALKKLYPRLADKTVIVGLSQGGHTALASLALAESYGVQGKLTGVAAYAPLWFSQRTWGVLLNPGVAQSLDVTIAKSPSPSAITIWYHYTKAELLDGPGEGEKLFRADARATIKQFVETQCWADSYPQLEALGTYAYELFDQSMVDSIGDAAAFGTCPAGNALCEKWIARYIADRPKFTGATAQVPILFLYGGKDTSLPPARAKCALDKLNADGVNLSFCYEPEGGHGELINVRGDYVADWIAQQALGAAAPPACPSADAFTATCATPPPND